MPETKSELDKEYTKEYFRSGVYAGIFEPEGEGGRGGKLDLRERLDLMEFTEPEGKTVLDIGTGKGRLAISFALCGAKRVVGMDISQEMLHIGEERAAAAGVRDVISFELGDAESLKYEDESFDIVCCIGVFSYLPPWRGMNEFARVCKHGGMVVVNMANADYRNFVGRGQNLLTKSRAAYLVVTAIYFSKLFTPLRKKLCQVYGLPPVRTQTRPKVLTKKYTKKEFLSFFQGAGLRIEKVNEYGGRIPCRFLVFGSKP
jgi:ubiquinone/menaquinone biosynthesis C-methylase UbiE